MTKTELNIDNLTHLWRVGGETFQNADKHKNFFLSYRENAEWPNRIWIKDLPTEETVKKVKINMENFNGLTFSYFNRESVNNHVFADLGFQLKTVQYGMSLSLKNKFATKQKIVFRKVSTPFEADVWASSFFKAFNYSITAETVLNTKSDIQYFLVYCHNEIIGTILLFITDNVLGIHSLGILPSQRKRGFATEIMHHALNNAMDQNLNLATLQASEMAKGMYLKMGFTMDFLMQNFTLNI